jgi:NTE family protein
MASTSLPLFFPAVLLDGQWYGDGGIRLATPLSPAIHLGASRILAIGTRYERAAGEDEAVIGGYPPPAQVIGIALNAIFLDAMDEDALRLNELNRMIDRIPAERRDHLRPIKLLIIRPSRDLGRLSREFEPRLPKTFRFLERGLGTRDTRSPDILSLLMFQSDYLKRLIEIGETDADAKADELAAFLAD